MFKFSFRNQVLAGFSVSILLVLLVGILSYNSITQLDEDTAMVEHTQKVIKTSTNLLQQLIDAETGMRGYCATGKKVLLDPYNAALPAVYASLEDMRTLVSDNPIQVVRVDTIEALVSEQLRLLKLNIDTRDEKGLAFMVANNMFVNGKRSMDAIRTDLSHVMNTENQLLAERKASSKAASTNAILFICVGSLVFLIIILFLFRFIQRSFAEQKKIEEKITVANGELAEVLAENKAKNWLLTGSGQLNEKMSGQQSERELTENVLADVCRYTEASAGTIYLYNETENRLDLYSTYAFSNLSAIKRTVSLGEGWLGEVAKTGKAAVIKGKINDRLELQSSVLLNELTGAYISPLF
ncbi:CHASE3 domain-containing protein [Mucilaginibacter antarcticus]